MNEVTLVLSKPTCLRLLTILDFRDYCQIYDSSTNTTNSYDTVAGSRYHHHRGTKRGPHRIAVVVWQSVFIPFLVWNLFSIVDIFSDTCCPTNLLFCLNYIYKCLRSFFILFRSYPTGTMSPLYWASLRACESSQF